MREPEFAGPVRPRLLGPDSGERVLLPGRDIGERPRLLRRDSGERLLLLGRDSGERARLLDRDSGERLLLLGGDSGERSLLLGRDETGGGDSCSSGTGACCITIGVGERSPPLVRILIITGAWGTWGAGTAGADDTRRLPDVRDGDALVRDLCLASAKLQSRLARSVKITNVWTNFMFKNSSFISVSVTQ